MKGDFTRFTFNKDKRFTRVLKQQGRVDLDSDWNEQTAIEEYQDVTRTRDVIGPSGAPRVPFPGSPGGRGSFAVYFEGGKLRLAPGRMYVDGLLCELDGAVDFTNQPHNKPPSPVPADTQRDFIYLDVWERHITAVEDGSIREVALGGPDTATRLQTIWQARALRLASGQPFNCESGWQALLPPPSSGRLSAWVDADPQPGDECSLDPSGGYHGLENRLYRVEIHKAGSQAVASFKWSRENSAVLYPAATVTESGGGAAPRRVRLLQTGRDALLSIQNGDWVEVTSDTRDLAHQPGTLTRVDNLEQAGTVVVLADDVSAYFGEQNLKVRRWDQAGAALPLTPGPILLEDGIRISFAAGSYNTGDYWTFAARAAVRDNSTGDIEPLNSAPPQGIHHHYAPLGLVTWQLLASQQFNALITDCRALFPPLTDLRASDISFDDSLCQLNGVETVQQAIDRLCQAREGACTYVVKPGQDLQAVIDQIPAGGDASICFQVGSYGLKASVMVKNKGRLKLTGAGTGTRLVVNKAEAALVFDSCESVLVRDLSAESRAQGAIEAHLNGVLTFLGCAEVHVEAVELRCSHATDTLAACLAVRPAKAGSPGARIARVLHNHFYVGNDQAGALLVSVERSQVEDNVMEVIEFSGAVKLSDLVSGRRSRARLARLLFSNAQAGAGGLVSKAGGIVAANTGALLIHNVVGGLSAGAGAAAGAGISAGAAAGLATGAGAAAGAGVAAGAGASVGANAAGGAAGAGAAAGVEAGAGVTAVAPPGTEGSPPGAAGTATATGVPVGLNAGIQVGDFSVYFLTNSSLRKSWQALTTLYPAENITDAQAAQKYMRRLVGKVLTDERVRAAVPTIRDFIANMVTQAAAAAQQGIVIAGANAADVRVVNNTLLGFRQGVHIGLSHREATVGLPDKAGAVTLTGNRMIVRLTFDALLEGRHGIFVGNCASLLMENNHISLDRRKGSERYEIQGVLLHGFFGPRLLVRSNHLQGFRVGIQIIPLSRAHTPLPTGRLWIAGENIAEKASIVVQAPAVVTQTNNVA
jgi:hypothetical protein